MQEDYIYTPSGPASTDDISIDLYSEHQLNEDIKANLGAHLTSKLPKAHGNRILIIGGNAGTTTELLLPFCDRIDVVVQKSHLPILNALFIKNSTVKYTFYEEGYIGKQYTLPKVQIGKCQINIVEIGKFHQTVTNQNSYNVVLLQNVIIHPQINIVEQLMRISHDVLITMIIPGKIVHENLFQLLSGIEENILNLFYNQQVHERLQFTRYLTGRRRQVNFWEIFVWKKKNQSDAAEQLIKITQILEDQVKKNKIGQPSDKAKGVDIYETQQSIDQYVDFHFGTTEYFGVKNYPLNCAEKIIEVASAHNLKGRALDIGCAVGRSTIQLASHFEQVVGIDYSHGFIKAADAILKGKFPNLDKKVKFLQGDACKLNKDIGKFDVIFGGNLIDRLYKPIEFLSHVTEFMNSKSILILSSPYTWLLDYTKKEDWIGGYVKNEKEVRTQENLKQIFQGMGLKEERPSQDIQFVIRENHWVFQTTSANFTFWLKQ